MIVPVYKDDDGAVPKNANLVVKRKPAPAGTGLLTKLAAVSTRGGQHSSTRFEIAVYAP